MPATPNPTAAPPAAAPTHSSEWRALLLTDVVDSTQLSQALGDERMAALWNDHDRAARDLLLPHRGREIDKTDGMLLLFEQVADALAYARAYHAALARLPHPMQARAGLHVGSVLLRENSRDDVTRGAKLLEVDGLAKPTTARIMALARGGQTLLSGQACQALDGALEVRPSQGMHSHGFWRLKGVADPVQLFEASAPPYAALPDSDKAYRVVRHGERWLPRRELPNNLPPQATSFHGRDRELDEVKAALQSARLVTLLGMGGLGKTRLSLQVAAELLGDFPDGAWFLDLSPLREPALVVAEAARLLQVQEQPGRTLLQALCTALQDRCLLLIIDNCEHLVEAAAELAHALLRAAPQLRLLTSSRAALRISGEQTYAVQPLRVPGLQPDLSDLAGLARLPAVQLFVERARAHRSDFVFDAAQARAVAELVTRLEGIPLALELAAARVRSLSVADINTRLKDRYKLLTGGNRGLQQRQQTLRALVDWSYDLLPPAEQTLLQRLGVFSGGFDLAAAEAVCGAEPLDPVDVLDLIDRLVENSLVVLDGAGAADGGTRYAMLETLREYALDKLQQSGAAAATGSRHCEHFFSLAKQARDGLQGAQQALWVQRVETDLDNLRAAMALARQGGAEPLLAAKLAVALQGFWVLRAYLSEGREHIRAALALPAVQASDMARAHTLYVGAVLADAQGDPAEAERLLETSLVLRRGLGDTAGTANTLSTLALARLATGQAAAALAAEQEALPLFRLLGHRLGEAIGLQHLGRIHLVLDHADLALGHLQESLALSRALGNPEAEGDCELLLGEAGLAQGDTAMARQHLQRSLQLGREAGDRRGEAKALAALGRLALRSGGDVAGAQPLLEQALQAFVRYEMRAELLGALEDHAALALALGQHERGACLLAAATQARRALGLPRAPEAQARCLVLREALQARLGDWGWAVAEAAGAATTLGDAAQAALGLQPAAAKLQPTLPKSDRLLEG